MDNYHERPVHIMFRAINTGDLAGLIRLREGGYPLDDPWACICAAGNGHLDILQWLRENGCPWDDRTCIYAASGGHLEALRWAMENGCPVNDWVCAAAAEKGHLDVLMWIYENGGAYRYPDRGVHPDCLEFWEDHAIPHWSRGEYVPVSPAPKPAKRGNVPPSS